MHSNIKNLACLPCVLTVCFTLAGCSDSDRNNNNSPISASDSATNQIRAVGTNVDNTANNTRDRDRSNATPLDQGNSPADRDVTAKIRQAIVSGTNNYSTLARNIKIITRDGSVTLRGPVQTDNEKSTIIVIAKGIAGETNVNDQLEVKASSNP